MRVELIIVILLNLRFTFSMRKNEKICDQVLSNVLKHGQKEYYACFCGGLNTVCVTEVKTNATKKILRPENSSQRSPNHNIQVIYFMVKNLPKEIPDAIFQEFRHVQQFFADSCGINKIESGTFANAENLKAIDISDNYIHTLPNDTFLGANKLEELTLYHNSIEFLEPNAFKGLKKLTRLHMTRNLIQTLPQDIFKPLINLKKLSLNDNYIKSLPKDLLRFNHKLEYISLDRNLLRNVQDNRMFSHLRYLKFIDLAFNYCSKKTYFMDNTEIRDIENDLLACNI